jgi:two-component system chemotaxis response regulator CheY
MATRSEKILIVDDAKFMRVVIRRLFEKYGFDKIFEAEDVEEALKAYNLNKPDFVTMDITMPGDSGLEGLRMIKEINPAARVLMVSAVSNKANIVKAFALGALYFLAKPFTEEAFDAVVAKAFEFERSFQSKQNGGPQLNAGQATALASRPAMVLMMEPGDVEINVAEGAVIGRCCKCQDDSEKGRNMEKCFTEAGKKDFIPCKLTNIAEQQVKITFDNGNYFVTALAESKYITKLNLIPITPGEKRLIRSGDVLTFSGADFNFAPVK